jgi:hypothetical protein
MPVMHSRQQVASILASVGELRIWVKRIIAETSIAKPSFTDLCSLSEQMLSAATELTSMAIQVTQAAQEIYNQERIDRKVS